MRRRCSYIRFIATATLVAAGINWPCKVAADSLVTVRGDVLNGKLLAIENQSAIFVRKKSKLNIPLREVTFLRTDAPFVLIINGGERVTGLLTVNQGKWRIQSVYGEVAIGLDEIRNGALSPEAVADISKPSDDSLALVAGRGDTPTSGAPSASDSASDTPVPLKPGAGKAAVGTKSDSTQELSFLRSEAVLLKDRQIEVDVNIAYLRNERLIQSNRALIGTIGIRANFLPNIESFVFVPLVTGKRTLFLDRETSTNSFGVGDIRFGAKFRLAGQTANWPETIANISIVAPTGKAPYNQPPPLPPGISEVLNTLSASVSLDPRNPFRFPTGSGHWAGTVGATLIRVFDPIVLFGGADYKYVIPATYFGTRVQPGQLYGMNMGLGFAVSERSTLSQQIILQHERAWRLNGGRLARSGGDPVALRLGYTHVSSDGAVFGPSIQFGLTRDSTDVVFALSYTKRY